MKSLKCSKNTYQEAKQSPGSFNLALLIQEKILRLENLISKAKNIVFLTGAGISTNSGLPDFRSDNGFWKTNKPIMFRDFLNSYESRKLSWKRNIALNKALEEIEPNAGHMFVKKILDVKKGCVITQNIDGLHHKSGIQNQKIVEVHGNATKAKCLDCELELDLQPFHQSVINDEDIPTCPKCFGLVKVATISFGQPMNMNDFEKSKNKIAESDLMIVLGSSLQVQPVASLPLFAAQNKKKVIIINNDSTSLDHHAELCINEDICSIVKQIKI